MYHHKGRRAILRIIRRRASRLSCAGAAADRVRVSSAAQPSSRAWGGETIEPRASFHEFKRPAAARLEKNDAERN